MGESSGISWTDHTFNPWWGCVKVSPGCKHCYAEAFSKRVGEAVWGERAPRRFFGDKHWAAPLKWNAKAVKEGVRRRVFCGSMCDWAEDRGDLIYEREKLWELIRATPGLDWLLLTKRPENIAGMLPKDWRAGGYSNVWLGTTVENQEAAEKRLSVLLEVPAVVHFASMEPLLGAVVLNEWLVPTTVRHCCMDVSGALRHGWLDCMQTADGRKYSKEESRAALENLLAQGIEVIPVGPRCDRFDDKVGCLGHEGAVLDWVIIGGESGPGFRAMELDWARHVREQCQAAGVAVWFKQVSGLRPGQGVDALGAVVQELPGIHHRDTEGTEKIEEGTVA